jgi:hypothetical protein
MTVLEISTGKNLEAAAARICSRYGVLLREIFLSPLDDAGRPDCRTRFVSPLISPIVLLRVINKRANNETSPPAIGGGEGS